MNRIRSTEKILVDREIKTRRTFFSFFFFFLEIKEKYDEKWRVTENAQKEYQ